MTFTDRIADVVFNRPGALRSPFRIAVALLLVAMAVGQVLQHRRASPAMIAGARWIAARCPAVGLVVPAQASDVDLAGALDDWAIAATARTLVEEIGRGEAGSRMWGGKDPPRRLTRAAGRR